MKNFKQIARNTIGLAVFSAACIISASNVSAWGPDRATFTMKNPATYPTFNSIIDAPDIGDERDFVRVGQLNDDVTSLKNEVEVIPGHQYLVYIYFHNNASATFNDAAHNNSGVAFKTKMATSFPATLKAGEKGTITGKITAENSNPGSVWDEAYFTTSSQKVFLRYVTGSAKIYNDWKANGSVMPSSLFTEGGTFIGLNTLNGIILGCEEYHGSVMYVVQADTLEGTIEKQISKDGEKFYTNADVSPGDEITYKLTIKNMGGLALENVLVKDSLPDKMSLVPGSVEFWANDSTTKDKLPDNIISNGYNLGTIGTGNVAYITYRAKVSEDIDCGSTILKNTATLTYNSDSENGDSSSSSSTATVKKDGCTPPPEDCTTNPDLPECQDCTTNPDLPGCKKDCTTNPELPECQRIPDTGPVEIILAIIIILGLGGAGYYYYRTQKKVKSVENKVSGKSDKTGKENATPENPVQIAGAEQQPKTDNKEPKADK